MASPYLKYKTLDELLSEAKGDLPKYNIEGFIETSQLIKVATTCNYKLGLKLQQEKHAVLEIDNNKVRLPLDFDILNYAKVCVEGIRVQPQIHGRQTEDVMLETVEDAGCDIDKVTVTCEKNIFIVKEICKGVHITYDKFHDIYLKITKELSDFCFNKQVRSPLTGYIQHGFLYTNFEYGKIYINYMGTMEDDEGNLLVPDHDGLNEYYEYAVKERVLENMFLAGEPVDKQLQLVQVKLKDAKIAAMSLVNMPDFSEMKDVWEMNRQAMIKKYYRIFE